MRLTRITLHNFLNYEDADIDLSGIDQAVVVGEVGAGKSSLIDAFTWATWGKARGKVLDSVIREGAEECSVRIEADNGGHHMAITRTKSIGRDSTYTLEVDGQMQTKHTIGETQEAIVRLAGLRWGAAMAGPLMLQGDSDYFTRLEPRDAKDVLLGLFGLEHYAALEEVAKARRDSAAATVRSNNNMLADTMHVPGMMATAELTLPNLKERIETLGEAVHFGRERIAELTERTATMRATTDRAAAMNSQLEDLRKRFTEAKQEQALTVAALTVAQNTAKVEMPEEVTPEQVMAVEERRRAAVAEHARLYGEYVNAQAEHRAAETSQEVTCPHCGTVFKPGVTTDIAVLAERMLRLEKEWRASEKARNDADAKVTAVRAAERMYMEARTLRINSEAELKRLHEKAKGGQKLLDELGAQGKVLRAEVEAMDKVGPELTSALDELASARGALANNEEALKAAERETIELEAAMAEWRRIMERRTQLEAERETAMADAKAYGWLAKAYHRDGIPTLMLESNLPVIEARANDVLSRMPGNFRVALSTQRETATGKASERLDVLVEVNGRTREYDLLSGGQKFRVDLALRMGILAAQGTFDTLVIDEGLDRFQDDVGREALLDSLAAVTPDFGLTLVISHHPEVIERIEHRIEVTLEEGASVARVR